MTPDQIDPFLKSQVDCKASLHNMIAENIAWHLKRLPEKRDRRTVILNLSRHVCLECGNDKLPCFCIADD